MGRMLAGALASAGPEARDCYWGPTDASGLAALGLNEVLLLALDVTRGLGERWTPSAPLCAAVLDRLFPAAPSDDLVGVLLWSRGRAELPGHAPVTQSRVPAAVG